MAQTDALMDAGVSGERNTKKRLIDSFTIPVVVVIALFLVRFANPISHDPDLYWHLKTGEYIVMTGTLPYADIFSHTASGKEWVLHEWLSEVFFYTITKVAGMKALWAVVAGLCTLTFYVLFKLSTRILRNETRALIVTMLFFAPLIPFASPRPQIFTYLFFAIFLSILFDWKYFQRDRGLLLLPPMMLVWANLHGAFVAGIALLALFLACEWFGWFTSSPPKAGRTARLKALSIWAALAVLATLANPRFIDYWLYPFYVVNLAVAKGIIDEWQSPNFHLLPYRYVLVVIFVFFLVLIYSRKKPDLTEICVPLFFIAAGFTAIRHLPLACSAALPFCALLARDLPLPACEWKRSRGSSVPVNKSFNRQVNERHLPYLNLLLLCAVTAGVLYIQNQRPSEELVESMLPVKAADFVIDNGIEGRMFNEYGEGGYLIYRLFPRQKVFVDGRADMYGDRFIKDYSSIMAGKPDWKQMLDEYAVDYVIVPREMPLRQLLLSDRTFKLVYDDKYRSVLVRDISKFARLKALIPPEPSIATRRALNG